MFKRNKVTEHVNLLEADGSVSAMIRKKNNQSGGTALLIVGLLVSLVAVLGTYGVLSLMNAKVVSDNKALQAKIDSPETAALRQQYQDLKVLREKVATYNTLITNSSEAYKSQPVLTRECFDVIDKSIEDVMGKVVDSADVEIEQFAYESGIISVPVQIRTADQFSQKYPAALVKHLYEQGMFTYVKYEGYEVSEAETDDAGRRLTPNGKVIEGVGEDDVVNYVTFELQFSLESDQDPNLEVKKEESAE